MIAKYFGERTTVDNLSGNELELKPGKEYDVKIKMTPGGTFLDLVVYRTTDIDDTDAYIIKYNDINDIIKSWEAPIFGLVVNEPKEENKVKVFGYAGTVTYIGEDCSISDNIDLVNSTEYIIRISYKYPVITFTVYSDDDYSANIMYLNTEKITKNWSGTSEFEDAIKQLDQDMKKHHINQQQYIYGNKSRLELLESSMKDKDAGSLTFGEYIDDGQDVRPLTFAEYTKRFKSTASRITSIDPTWLKVIVYDLIEKQLKSYDEDELEFIACCESDTELANYVRGLIDLADSIINKDDKSVEERAGE